MSMLVWRVLFLLLAALPAAASAGSVVNLQQADSVRLAGRLDYLEDPSGRMTLAEVMAPEIGAKFAALPGPRDANFGYSASAYWLRFAVRAARDAPDHHWVLEIAYASLDRVEVYLTEGTSVLSRAQAGDLRPFRDRPVAHRNLVFPLTLAAERDYTVYVHVQSQGNLTLPMTLRTVPAQQRRDQVTYTRHALYFGALLALATYNLLLGLSLRERQYFEYVAFAACMIVGQASLYGFGNQFLWPDWPQFGNAVFPAAMSATGLFGALFTRSFLDSPHTIPRLDKGIVALAVLFLVGVLAPFLAPYRAAAIFVSLTGVSFAALATVAGVVSLRHDYHGARYFLLAWTLLLAGVLATGLRNVGVIPSNDLSLHAMQIGSALEMLLLSFALADRFHRLRREKELAQAEAIAAKQDLVESLTRSEHKLAERVAARTRDLEDREQQLQAVLDNAADGILTVSAEGTIETVNRAVERLFGYPAAALIGRPLPSLFPGQTLDALLKPRPAEAMHEGSALRRDGVHIPVELALGEIDLGDQRLYVLVLHDLTDRKRMEKLQAEFVAAVSHELRTPLTSLRGSLGLLAGGVAGELPGQSRNLLQIAHNNAERLSSLINDILDVEKLEYGSLPFNAVVQPLAPLVGKALEMNRGFADQAAVTLDFQPGDGADIRVNVDGDRLLQVLTNILSNAIKFSPHGGTVQVVVTEAGGRARVAVRDQGPGVPDGFRGRIFQKFAQARQEGPWQHTGTGLGLSLAKGMIERMGGSIGYHSVAGHGATFFIELPVVG